MLRCHVKKVLHRAAFDRLLLHQFIDDHLQCCCVVGLLKQMIDFVQQATLELFHLPFCRYWPVNFDSATMPASKIKTSSSSQSLVDLDRPF